MTTFEANRGRIKTHLTGNKTYCWACALESSVGEHDIELEFSNWKTGENCSIPLCSRCLKSLINLLKETHDTVEVQKLLD
jgi:hypothetical protein